MNANDASLFVNFKSELLIRPIKLFNLKMFEESKYIFQKKDLE